MRCIVCLCTITFTFVAATAINAGAADSAFAGPLPEFTTTAEFGIVSGSETATFEAVSTAKMVCQAAVSKSTSLAEEPTFIKKTKLGQKFLLKFTGCTSGGFNCSSAGAAAGEILTAKLEAEIGYLPGSAEKVATLAFIFRPLTEPLMKFTCEKLDEIKGCIAGTITPALKPVVAFTDEFVQAGGKQKYIRYEPTKGNPQPCEAKISIGGGAEEQVGLSTKQNVITCPNMEEIKD